MLMAINYPITDALYRYIELWTAWESQCNNYVQTVIIRLLMLRFSIVFKIILDLK